MKENIAIGISAIALVFSIASALYTRIKAIEAVRCNRMARSKVAEGILIDIDESAVAIEEETNKEVLERSILQIVK